MSEVYNPAQESSWYDGMEDGIGGCEITVSDAEVCIIDDRFSSYKRSISLEEYINETEYEPLDQKIFFQLRASRRDTLNEYTLS
jgi:hypothetical protein